jgi:hypothetical protein
MRSFASSTSACASLNRNAIVGWIDNKQEIALVDILIVGDLELDDTPSDFGRYRDDVHTNRPVARPGGKHVGAPHEPACRK